MTHLVRRLTASVLTAAVVSALSLGFLASSTSAASLTAGNLVVEQLTGTSGSATAISILEYTKSGSSVQTIAFPSSGANQQTDSVSATSNGSINTYNINTYNGYRSVPGQNGGIRGLTGSYANGTATLFATTGETSNNRLISILDTGSATPSSYTQFGSAGVNQVFRGVDIVTVPEPTSLAALGCAAALYAALRLRRRAA